MKRTKQTHIKSQSGFSLMAMMVTLAILGVSFTLYTHLYGYQVSEELIVEREQDLIDLRRYVMRKFNCFESAYPRPDACSSPGASALVELRDPSGIVFVNKSTTSPTIIGKKYALRAKCMKCPTCSGRLKFVVEVQTQNKNRFDTQSKFKNKNWFDLFRAIPLACEIPV